nr:sigma-70 family RNA polymerase sigma factor [Allonocardiopsis opalescens]
MSMNSQVTPVDLAAPDRSGPDGAADFPRLADPYRHELLAHCYRMVGSLHDAEDLVQETYLRAWRGYAGFEGRSSLRTWLYRIATTVCLTALGRRARRPLPTGLGQPGSDAADPLVERAELPWLEPVPDALVGAGSGGPADPASVVTERESVRLALVAALQHLPPRQRAVLILRDVLKWRAAEVADLLDTSTAAVNSALQRARGHLAVVGPTEDGTAEPSAARQREQIDRYAAAFERKDVAGIVRLLTDDVVWEMPPYANWYRGSDQVATHLRDRCPGGPGDFWVLRTAANGQPALALYLRGPGGAYRPFLLQVLAFSGSGRISRVVNFMDVRLFAAFGLPEERPPR